MYQFLFEFILLLLTNNIITARASNYNSKQLLTFIENNSTLWSTEGDSSYEFVFSWSCNCGNCWISDKKIKVLHSSISKVQFDDDNDKNSCSKSYLSKTDYKTINQLFEILKNYTKTAYSMSVTFDEQLGYPTNAWIDPDEMEADEEFGWSIDCLSIYTRSDVKDYCKNKHEKSTFIWDYIGWILLGVALVACLIIGLFWYRTKNKQPKSVEIVDQSNPAQRKAKYAKMEEDQENNEFDLDEDIDNQ